MAESSRDRQSPRPPHQNGDGSSSKLFGRGSTVRTEEDKQTAAKAEYEKLLTMRSGGTYIPPARLRALQSQITDKSSKEYQRMAWEALKKSINGLINKVNVSNIKYILPELFGENLIRGRGLFCRSIMKAQAASLPFTPIYAAMAAIVNTKLPKVGELLLTRLVIQFKKGFKRNDKAVCLSATTFIAHLCNQQVANEVVAAQILLLLLNKPTDDSVEIAVGLTREVGQHMGEMNPPVALAVFEQFRNILHEADIDKRVQYMIEVLFEVRKNKYRDNPAIKEELDLVEEEDQITHTIILNDPNQALDIEDGLNIFKFDPDWEANEEAYKNLKAEILGEDSADDEEDTDEDDSEDDEVQKAEKSVEIKDQSNTDLINLRRTIYLTIMNSIDPEEAVHKLMKVKIPPGQEAELPSMIVECCSQDKTYTKFFGLMGERFAKINRLWTDLFEQSFAKYYDTIHRYETNKLRNIARFFGHLVSTDAIGWHVLSVVHLNEEETTSSSRIFIKILFQDLAEAMGMPKLQERLKDPVLSSYFGGIFPRDSARNTRFSINYFTSIGMGAVTEDMRQYLQNIPKPALPPPPADAESDSESSVSSYSSYTGSSYSRSRSPTPARAAKGRRSDSSRSPSPYRPRAIKRRSSSLSRSRSRSRSRTRSFTPPRVARARSRSFTPPRVGNGKAVQRDRSWPRSVSRARNFAHSRRDARIAAGSISPPAWATRRRSRSITPPYRAAERPSLPRSPSPLRRGRRDSRSPPRKAVRRNTSSVSVAPRRCQDSPSRSRSRSPPRRRRDASFSRNRPPIRWRSRSITPAVKRPRNYSDSRSTPPKRGRRYS
ncbi:hypothetical protein BJ878DRAFT_413507 [Calycina marina]|uniref:Pre-mRNA-splicing factor CWC22 n=1 Tax=Calycina marina TaxID=1763456 RepID=A0A9P7Z9K4_9HELO|nr:hypothetical protein BJ878DRAFT_413507 [Calycina marina]